jgi:hypothetical protein
MPDLKFYIPKALVFQRLIKSAIGAANHIDRGTEINDAHAFALLEFFEFLTPEQLTPVMGPGLAAEISAIIESEFSWAALSERTPVQNLLCTHACVFAGIFCRDGDEEPKCCRTWRRFQQRNAVLYPRDRAKSLMANFEVAMGLGRDGQTMNPKVQLLKYRIAARTAEALLAIGFDPEETLRQIRRDDIPSPAEILAMQVFVLLKKSSDDLARACNWTDAHSEATFLHWASTDPFVREALVAWRWLKPITYDQFSADAPEPLEDRGGPLYASWRQGRASPANLAIREEPWSEPDAEPHLPRLLPKDVKARFCPVPLMLIGGPAVGKTSFLRALSRHLNCARGQLHEGTYLESSDLQQLWNRMGERPALGTKNATSETAGYNVLVRDERDPEVARWMRLRFTDCKGEEIDRQTLTPELLRILRAARGLMFFVDDRSFADLRFDDRVAGSVGSDSKDAEEVAAQYTRILQWYFDINKDALHLPVALVVNKADLLLGRTNLLSLNPPFLIPEQTKMELVHAGLHLQSEATEPFDRLRSCIRHNPAISRNIQTQRFVFELIERFKGFIAAAMCHTYRFQIFLTSSVAQKQDCECLPHGVWDVTKWVVNQLESAYRAQVIESVNRAHAELAEIKNGLGAAMKRDQQSHLAFLRAVTRREQVTTLTRLEVLDRLLQNRIEHTSEKMRTALQYALALVELQITPDTTDPAPFLLRRRLAKESVERLEDQIRYLQEWEDRYSGLHPAVPVRPKPSKKDVSSVNGLPVTVRRAS